MKILQKILHDNKRKRKNGSIMPFYFLMAGIAGFESVNSVIFLYLLKCLISSHYFTVYFIHLAFFIPLNLIISLLKYFTNTSQEHKKRGSR